MFNFSSPEDKFEVCGHSKKLKYSANRFIGNGSNSTVVYEGRFEGHPVAVKMIHKDTFKGISEKVISETMGEEEINEAQILRQYEHKNVIRYYLLDHDNRFIYLGLELCKGNLAEYLEFGRPERLPSGDGRQIMKKHLLQGILEGLDYLHGADIIHNDLKPQNILLQVNKSKQDCSTDHEIKYNAVISDFGVSLKIDPGRRSKTVIDDLIGTEGWRPKEVVVKLEEFYKKYSDGSRPHMSLEQEFDHLSLEKGKIKGTKHVDIFAFGCIIQYVMAEKENSRGSVWYMHPFGDERFRNENIKQETRWAYISKTKGKTYKNMLKLDEILADMLVGLCIDKDPECRPNTKEINKHPFFWEPSARYQFIEKTANEVKSLSPKNDFLELLNKKWKQFHPWSYQKEIMNAVEYIKKTYEAKQFKFNPGRCFYIDALLKDIRNIKQHYSEIRKEYGDDLDITSDLGDGDDEDFDRYFLQKIVQILPVVYTCFYKIPRNKMGAYKAYFSNTEESALIDLREKVYWYTLSEILCTPADNSTVKDQPMVGSKKRARSRTPSGQS